MHQRVGMTHERDYFIFTDERGDEWRLQPTGDPSLPLTITLVSRYDAGRHGRGTTEPWHDYTRPLTVPES